MKTVSVIAYDGLYVYEYESIPSTSMISKLWMATIDVDQTPG